MRHFFLLLPLLLFVAPGLTGSPLTLQKIRIIRTGFHPKESIFSPDGRLIIITPLWDKRSLQVYDWKKNRMRSFSVPHSEKRKGSVEGVFTRDQKEFWFTQMTGSTVFVYSYPGFRLLHEIKTGGRMPKVIEFSPDGRLALVSNWAGGDLTLIDVSTHKPLKRIPTGTRAPRGIAFTPDRKFVYAVSFQSGHIIKLKRAGWQVIRRIHTGGANGRIRLDRKGRYAYINNMAQCRLFKFDLRTDRIVASVRTGSNPNNVRLSPDGSCVFVACRGPNNPQNYLWRSPRNGRIQVFRTRDLKKIQEIPGGNQCVGLDISPDGKLLVFSNLQDHTIHLYRIKTP